MPHSRRCITRIQAGRLTADQYADNFADAHPPLTPAQALIEAERCYYCYDAPCIQACPTGIDIPSFIRRISEDNLRGAARAILEANVFGGMCARVCPTEVLCEQACVRNTHEDKPVEIGLLQRHATDHYFAKPGTPLFTRAAPTGRRIAVVGAGPAGLSCAHRAALLGHDVTVFDAKPKAGGLNEYGLATYKTVDGFAQKEIDWLLSIGGIELRCGEALGEQLLLDDLTPRLRRRLHRRRPRRRQRARPRRRERSRRAATRSTSSPRCARSPTTARCRSAAASSCSAAA